MVLFVWFVLFIWLNQTDQMNQINLSRRMLKKTVRQGRRRVETGGVPLGYIEDFDEPRTLLADFFSILLESVHTYA